MREVEKSGAGVLSPICHKKQSSSSHNTTARGSGKQFFRKVITGFISSVSSYIVLDLAREQRVHGHFTMDALDLLNAKSKKFFTSNL